MTHVSLFSGIGGIDLAADWAGFRTIVQVERDPYCQRVLEKHWPGVHRVSDIRDFPDKDYGAVTLVSGGFPCQDLSTAGRKQGLSGSRSGLWYEMLRTVDELKPVWVLVENVHQVWRRWLPTVRCSLWAIRYSSLSFHVRADFVGACHRRSRVFVVAHSDSRKLWILSRWLEWEGWQKALQSMEPWDSAPRGLGAYDGVPHRVDRLRGLGNAVVPQQCYPILRAIAEVELGT